MNDLDDKIMDNSNLLSKEKDQNIYSAIESYYIKVTKGGNLTPAERFVLLKFKEDIEKRYENYSDSISYKAIASTLKGGGISIMKVESYDKNTELRELTTIMRKLDFENKKKNIMSPELRHILVEHNNYIRKNLSPQYFYQVG